MAAVSGNAELQTPPRHITNVPVSVCLYVGCSKAPKQKTKKISKVMKTGQQTQTVTANHQESFEQIRLALPL